MQDRQRSVADELPEPSAELVLIRIAIQAYLATAHEKPRRRAAAFMREASSILANEESVSDLLPIRPSTDHAAVAKARREAMAIFRQLIPALIAKVPPE